MTWARHFVTGLSSLRDRARSGLAAARINPSRSATITLRSFSDTFGTTHEVTAMFSTRKEAEEFFDYLERLAP